MFETVLDPKEIVRLAVETRAPEMVEAAHRAIDGWDYPSSLIAAAHALLDAGLDPGSGWQVQYGLGFRDGDDREMDRVRLVYRGILKDRFCDLRNTKEFHQTLRLLAKDVALGVRLRDMADG